MGDSGNMRLGGQGHGFTQAALGPAIHTSEKLGRCLGKMYYCEGLLLSCGVISLLPGNFLYYPTKML